MIKYLGSKRRLLPHIRACLAALPDVRTVLDCFSGTSRVGHALKADGFQVVSNDHNEYAHVFARCYVQADADQVRAPTQALLDAWSVLPGERGYFTTTFCEDARFIRPGNGMRIDAIRRAIREAQLAPDLEAVCLTALVEAADRVDSTTGVQMAYLKSWAPRAERDLELRMPDVLPGRGRALCLDAALAAGHVSADVVYLDPPYNQHSYRSNYHIWETLVRDDQPEWYGVARKRVDCRTRKSPFNSKRAIQRAFRAVIDATRSKYLVVSFNDEGYLSRDEVEEVLRERGALATFAVPQARYVGARIGIHNRKGERVGAVGRLQNVEYLFVVAPTADVLDPVATALAALDRPAALV